MPAFRAVSTLLLISGLLLASLTPGGPVETRDFSEIQGWVLGAFNVSLTVLIVGSCLLAWLVLNERCRWYWPFCAGVGYFLVYGLDLLGIFPVSPTPMNQALWAIEVAGMVLAMPLMTLSGMNLQHSEQIGHSENVPGAAWFVAGAISLLIVGFTTTAAMSG